MKSSERPGRVTYRLCRSYQAVQLSVERKISLMNYFYRSTLSRAALAHCYGQGLWAHIHWAVVFLLFILSFIVLFCLHIFFYIFNFFFSIIYLFIYSILPVVPSLFSPVKQTQGTITVLQKSPPLAQQLLMGQDFLRHTTLSRTSLDEWSGHRRDLYLTTHITYKGDRHLASGGIRTHIPSKRLAVDPRRRPRGHWDRLANNLLYSHRDNTTFNIIYRFLQNMVAAS